MPKACPAVHLHPAFEASYDPHDKDQSNYKERLVTRLKTGNQTGLKKGGDLEPLYGFPTGHKSTNTNKGVKSLFDYLLAGRTGSISRLAKKRPDPL